MSLGGVNNFGRSFRFYYDSSEGDANRMENRMSLYFKGGESIGEHGATEVDYAIFAFFDGRDGVDGAVFARKNLRSLITTSPDFNSHDDNLVVKAIIDGFMKLGETWPYSSYWKRSKSKTTITVAVVKNSKLYVAYIGDSGVAMGTLEQSGSTSWQTPWHTEEITFDPRAKVIKLDGTQRCLVIGNSGIWTVLNPRRTVSIVNSVELNNLRRKGAATKKGSPASSFLHPAGRIVRQAVLLRELKGLPKDDLAALVVYFD